METRTYKAGSMLEALQMVQNELGPDAIVLSAREASSGVLGLLGRPGVEVVAMAGANAVANVNAVTGGLLQQRQRVSNAVPRPNVPADGTAAGPARPAVDEERAQIEWVTGPEPRRAQIPVYTPPGYFPPESKTAAQENARPDLRSASGPTAEEKKPAAPVELKRLGPGTQKVRQDLLDQGVDAQLVERIFKVATEMITSGALNDADVCRKFVGKLLEAELKEVKNNAFTGGRRVICLVGAGGSGKTTTAAKLAFFYSQKLGRQVTWVCADTLRMGAIAEARAYCDALGLPLRLAYTPADLRAAISGEPAADQAAELVLVDTPGYNPFQEDQMVELGKLLSELRTTPQLRSTCSVYLTAAANVKESDLVRSAAALGIFGLDGLVLTRLDETSGFGSVYNFARKSQLPLGYFTAGRGADGPLQAASASRLVSALFGKGWVK